MRNRRRISFYRRAEEYAFGAAALKNEIRRHKEEDDEPWDLFKAVGIRALYAYAFIAALVLVMAGMIGQKLSQFGP